MDSFVKTTKEFKRIYEVDDADEITNMKKNTFKAWSTMVSMRGSDKRKYGESIHNFSIQYLIKNNQYPKTLQEAVYVMHKLNLNKKIIIIKVTRKKNLNRGGKRYKLNEKSVAQIQKHEKRCY